MSEREAYGAAAAGSGGPAGEERPGEPPATEGSLLELGPGLARIAATTAWRGGVWAADAYVRAGSRVMQAAVSGESAADLLQETGTELRGYARRLLGVLDEATEEKPAEEEAPESGTEELRRRGEELLSQSADVGFEEGFHPAYVRILGDLAPDEVRILRLQYRDGPRPAVDVRKGMPLLPIGSELIEQGLSMIGAEAGLRHVDRVHQYLNNLNRLGLVWFSRDPIPEVGRYQVIEAQPEVVEALERAGRLGHTVRRSVHLTPFGRDFCEVALPPESLRRWGEPADADESGGPDEGASESGARTTGTRPTGT
jgi:hypothetical protein